MKRFSCDWFTRSASVENKNIFTHLLRGPLWVFPYSVAHTHSRLPIQGLSRKTVNKLTLYISVEIRTIHWETLKVSWGGEPYQLPAPNSQCCWILVGSSAFQKHGFQNRKVSVKLSNEATYLCITWQRQNRQRSNQATKKRHLKWQESCGDKLLLDFSGC